MSTTPTLKPRDVIARLERLGFTEVRHKGSHKRFRHTDGRGATVPIHGGEDIRPPLLRHICREIGMTVREFIDA